MSVTNSTKPQTWLERLIERAGRLSLADEAIHMNDVQKVLAADRAAVDAHHAMHFPEYQRPKDDDMLIVGDVHVQQGATAPSETPAASKLSPLVKYGGLAALALASGGLGAAVPHLLGSAAPAAIQSAAPDVDRDWELIIPPATRDGGAGAGTAAGR